MPEEKKAAATTKKVVVKKSAVREKAEVAFEPVPKPKALEAKAPQYSAWQIRHMKTRR